MKYEEVYLKRHGSHQELLMGLARYFMFYSEKRLHQSLAYKTPEVVYRTAAGGGAKIVDKFNEATEASALV